MKRTIFIVVVFFAATLYAQGVDKNINDNPRVKRPYGLSFNLGGPTYVASVSMDCFILPVLNVEAGGGIWGYYAGPKYHFNGQKKYKEGTLYTGFVLTAYPPFIDEKRETGYGYYIPLGINSIADNGYTFSLEVAYNNRLDKGENFPLWFSLKFGYHF
ncbi:MAG: hypothetical protein KKG02_00480 [Candidatus Edwardsbacteria bacterium]|nr:hypothetical protein [Candidatus Edwardsbacteria bacterium]